MTVAIKTQPSLALVDFMTPPDNMECLKYTFFSRKAISAGAVGRETQFFSDQIGVGGATSRDTNMTKPAAMGNPRRFLMQWLNCAIYSVTAAEAIAVDVAEDIQQLLTQTYIRLELLDKEYLTVPTFAVPAGGGMWGAGGGTLAGPVFVTNGVPDKRNAYPVELPLEREASFTFKMINASSAGITTSKDLYVELLMTGLLLRPRQ